MKQQIFFGSFTKYFCLGVADFSEKWALLFTEAPKELPDRNISLIVIDMATMAIRHILKVGRCQ